MDFLALQVLVEPGDDVLQTLDATGLPERDNSCVSPGKRTMTTGFVRYFSARNICSPPAPGDSPEGWISQAHGTRTQAPPGNKGGKSEKRDL